MKRLLLCAWLATALVASASAFGNLDVSWMADGKSGSEAKAPTVAADKTRKNWKPTPEMRRSNLESMSVEALSGMVTAMGASCDTCTTSRHWVSKVRHTVLDLQNKKLKAELRKRGVKCEGCTQREQYVDLLLDSIHLPLVT